MKINWLQIALQVSALLLSTAAGADQFSREEMEVEQAPLISLWEGDFSISPALLIQLQVTPYVETREECFAGVCEKVSDAYIENYDPAHEPGFRFRRARAGARGQLMDGVEYGFMIETAGMSESGGLLLDASLSYTGIEYLNLSAGLGKVPFSRINMVSASFISLIERPISVQAISPDRQLGLTLSAAIPPVQDKLRFYAGIYNGEPGISGNANEGFLGALRLETTPLGEVGHTEMDFAGGMYPRLIAGIDAFKNVSATETDLALSADLTLKVAGFSLSGEYLWKETQPKKELVLPSSLRGKVESHGWFVQASFFEEITCIESVIRYERYDPNIFLDDEYDTQAVTAGLHYYMYANRLKLQLNYIWRDELFEAYARELANNALVLQAQLYF